MKCDLVLCGVGGQGVLSMAALVGEAALAAGLEAKQSEVHGMAQRGGAVSAHLRLADGPIASVLIPRGGADLILALEPLESLRYLEYLAPSGALVTATTPVVNVPDYPPLEDLLARIEARPSALLVDAEALARAVGDLVAVNTVMVGAAAHLLPIAADEIEAALARRFGRRGEAVLRINRAAFAAGRRAAREGALAI